jgi:hypothetical protein
MKYLMILLLAFVMSFSALGSTVLAKEELPVVQYVETGVDASESCDAEEPNPSDESKYFVVRSQYVDQNLLSSFQRVAFDYSYEEALAPNKPPQL